MPATGLQMSNRVCTRPLIACTDERGVWFNLKLKIMANLKDFLRSTIVNGGASYNVVTGQLNPTTGYMVALEGHERVIENVANEKQLQYIIADYLKDKAIILVSGITDENTFIGTWINEGKLYLDVSVNIADKDAAIALAKSSKQIAIWDCENAVEIRLV